MKFDGFEWDSYNPAKCQKHGVSVAEIERLFSGTPLVAPDALHSLNEQSFRAVGRTITKRHLFVVFTVRKTWRNTHDKADQCAIYAQKVERRS